MRIGNSAFVMNKIKIWNGTGETSIVYDNQMHAGDNAVITTAITGSIVIHTPPTKGTKAVLETAAALEAFEPETAQFYNYPNNFSRQTTVAFVLDTEESYSLEVYNHNGILIKKIAEGTAEAGRLYEYELDAEGLAQGMLIGRLVIRSGTRTIK